MSGAGPERPKGRPYKDFGIRAVSSVVLAVLVFVALYQGGFWWALVASSIGVLVTSEFYAVARVERRKPNELFGLLAVAAMPLATAWALSDAPATPDPLATAQHGLLGMTGVLAALVVAALVWHLIFPQVSTSDTAVTVFGVVYIGFTLTHLVLMRELDSGTEFVAATLVSVWANDILAYAIGSSFGRHRLAPKVSPKKSWEGLAAGTAGTMAVWLALGLFVQTGLPLWWLACIGLAVSAAAVVGDLAESRIKREAGVKDSGKLLPGHGGFLDRLDSTITASVVAFYLLAFGIQIFGAVR
jgi:phosphatidate cytidylyltransferase